MPEVSQSDLDLLLKSRRILDAMYSDPEDGLAVKKAFKKHVPDAVIPELAAEAAITPVIERVDAVGAALAKLNERMDAEALERQQAAQADALARQMAQARDRFRLTDEGIEGMTKLMSEKGIVDPNDAAELYVARQPKPKIASGRLGSYGQGTYADVTGFANEDEKRKLLLESPDRFLAAEVEQCLAEFDAEAA